MPSYLVLKIVLKDLFLLGLANIQLKGDENAYPHTEFKTCQKYNVYLVMIHLPDRT